MIQNQSLYEVEKMIQLKQSELSKGMRSGLYRKHIAPHAVSMQGLQRTTVPWWHKWFKKRRLDTSWK